MSYSSEDHGKDRAKQWIFLLKDKILETDHNIDTDPEICPLRHPKTGERSLFLFSQDNSSIYEVVAFKETCRSWFLDETVQQDGSLYMTTIVDPLYLILPCLVKAYKTAKFMQLDLILQDEDYPEMQRLSSCLSRDDLVYISDFKGDDDLQVYRYNEDNTLSWLKLKVEKVASKLEESRIPISGGSHAATYVQSRKSNQMSTDDYIRYAHGMVSDYLPLDLSQQLKEYMGIKEPVIEKPDIEEPPAKRIKKEAVMPEEDYSQKSGKENKKTGGKLTTAQKKLSKVDTSGMKNMSCFFKKK